VARGICQLGEGGLQEFYGQVGEGPGPMAEGDPRSSGQPWGHQKLWPDGVQLMMAAAVLLSGVCPCGWVYQGARPRRE